MNLDRLFIFCILLFSSVSLRSQGLRFVANERTIEERTSLEINCKKLHTAKRFELSFMLSMQDFETFGYIFLIEEARTCNKYSFTYTYVDGAHSAFKFNTDGVCNHFSMEVSNDSLAFRWIPVSFAFDLEGESLDISIDGHKHSVSIPELTPEFFPVLHFGKYDYILDIPSFAVKDMRLCGERGGMSIPFNETSGNEVHSADGRVVGHTSNPHWLVNNSYYWTKLFEFRSMTPAGIQYDAGSQRLVGFTQDSLYRYCLKDRKLEAVPYSGRLPVRLQLATSFMNPEDGQLYVYELNNLPIGDVTVAALDIDKGSWKSVGKASLPVQLHHHDGFWDGKSGRYVVFGGFGNKRFNNTFISYDPCQDIWDTIPYAGESIYPRYFSGMAASRDCERLYIYGGMGNSTGDQSMGRNYFHDLYVFDRAAGQVRRLWNMDSADKTVVARSMLLSPDEEYITAFLYPEYITDTRLQLVRFSVKDGSAEILADTVPMRSGEIATNANLHYNSCMSEYYCTIVEYGKDGTTLTKAFVLTAPAVGLDMMHPYSASGNGNLWKWLLAALAAVSAIAAFFLYRRGKRKALSQPVTDVAASPENVPARSKIPVAEPVPEPVQEKSAAPASNAIFLFGQFTVFDRNGRDITYLFSTRIRQVFVYLLINSYDSRGVLSSSLNEVFWPDKPHDKVKNIKGVTISQIRKCIAEMDGIALEYEKEYFHVTISDECYCDYFRYRSLKKVPEAYGELGTLLMRGKLLGSFASGMLDRTKQVEEEFLVAFLPVEIERLYARGKYSATVRYCRLLLDIEPANEFALAYEVRAVAHSVSSQQALIVYSLFVRQYRELMGEEFPVSFASLIAGELPKYQG